MARQRVPGSITSRRVVAVRPSEQQLAAFQDCADQWHCGLGEAVLRLALAGLRCPEHAPLSDRATIIYSRLCAGHTRQQLIDFATSAWGINHKQVDQLIVEAHAHLERKSMESRAQFLQTTLDSLKQIQAAAVQNSSSCVV